MEWNKALNLPDQFELVESTIQIRNQKHVTVERYQAQPEITPNNQHVTVVLDDSSALISYSNLAFEAKGDLIDDDEAISIAMTVFNELLPDYALDLSLMRVERQQRQYISSHSEEVKVPVLWVKFGHRNGSYNWVTVGPSGQIIEIERESLWDYVGNRRQTEMWNDDNWVQARLGLGPQLKKPNALA